MVKLEQLNGQQEAIDGVLSRRTVSAKEVVVISGSQGTGVTWTLERCAEAWEAAGGASVQVKGEPFASERALFPWLTMTSSPGKRRARFEVLKSGVAHGSRGIPFVGHVASFLIDELLNYRKRRLAREAIVLSQQEQDLLFVIQTVSQNKRLLMTVDHLEAWDQASWALLGLILSANLNELYPAVANALIVVGASREVPARLRSICGDLPVAEYAIRALDRQETFLAISAFGMPTTAAEDVDTLYTITNGRLDLLHDLATHLQRAPGSRLSAATQDFYDRLIDRRLADLSDRTPSLSGFLLAAAILGKAFAIEDVRCLTGYSQAELDAILRLAAAEQFVSAPSDVVSFNSKALHQHFLRERSPEHLIYHAKFAECLRTMRPGDYAHRLRHLLLAEKREDALTCYALAALSARRQHDPAPGSTGLEALTGWGEITSFLDTMRAAYDAYEHHYFDDGFQCLDKVEGFLPESLIAERDYLESQMLLKSARVSHYERAVKLLERWAPLKDREPEIWSRIGQVLVVALVETGRLEEARRLETDLATYYWSHRQVDPWALYSLNVLRRRSECLHHIPTATMHLERAITYFGPSEPHALPRHPIQFYYTLTNLIGNLTAGGRFDEAYQRSLELDALVREHQLIPWPGLENASNNLILAGLLSGNLAIGAAAALMEQVSEGATGAGDRILIQNNCAVLLIRTGQLAKGEGVLEKAYSGLIAATNPDEYHLYFVGNNLAFLRAVTGNRTDAERIYGGCCAGIEHLYPAVRQTLARRHELLSPVLATARDLGVEKLDAFLSNHYPLQVGPQWQFYGRTFLLSDIQFWSAD